MGQGPFGIMFQPSRILGCLLLAGWVTSTIAESEKTLCTRASGNDAAVCGPMNSIPDHLICNLEPAAVSQLGPNDALTLAQRISKNCLITHGKCLKSREKGTLPFQVAASLVSKFEEFSPEILSSLGQVAVGLSVHQIDQRIQDRDLLASLPSLSKVQGWSMQQVEAILRKLFSSGYQIQDGGSLAALGSLVVGLDPHQLQEVPPKIVPAALKFPGFTTQQKNVSPTQKMVFVEKSVLMPWLKCFLHNSHLPRKELATLVKTHRSARHRRAPDSPCPAGKNVTDEIAQDELMPIEYTAEELRTCLGQAVFLRNLASLSHFAFTEEQLFVMKQKLDETGYPDSVLRNLGSFMDLMGPEDIKKWRFNSTETLASLLAQEPSPELAAAIIRQYTNSGGPLNAEALNVIGTKYICLLDSDQLKKIDENAIKAADPLDLSNCNQTTKDILYPPAKRAFSDRHNTPEYYERIKPYLGGAPAEDLKALSKDNDNMDINTFMKLRVDAILELKPSEVKGLLGRNLPDLKAQENNPPVKDWIIRQRQSELDKLGIGLRGGTPEGYMNVTPRYNRPPETSGGPRGLALHLFSSLLLTLLLSFVLS